jgi:hypothetical protein
VAIFERAVLTGEVTLAGSLDLDDVCAKVGKNH